MTVEIPTVSEIHGDIISDIQANIPNSDPFLENSILDIISWAVAGTASGLYQKMSNEALQKFVTTATGQALEEKGAEYGVTRKSAQKSSGTVICTGQVGAEILAGTKLSSSSGNEYQVTLGIILVSGNNDLEIESVDTGADKNITAGATMTFSGTPIGVNQSVTVDSDGIVGGTNLQDDDSFRTSILDKIQKPSRGGNKTDYDFWSKDALNTVTRTWVFSKDDAGSTAVNNEVDLFFTMDDTYSDGIPQSGDVTIVQDYIDQDNVRPVSADVIVQAPTAVAVNFTMSITPDTPEIRTAIEDSLTNFIRRESAVYGTLYLSRINEAISLADGEFDHTLTVPSANVVSSYGNISTMGTITWT